MSVSTEKGTLLTMCDMYKLKLYYMNVQVYLYI